MAADYGPVTAEVNDPVGRARYCAHAEFEVGDR